MTQYQRITGKVFGGNATATGDDPQIAQFGSALANTFVGTTDPETIQQLPAWGQGWIGAVTPETQFPPLPEMTGAMKVLSHQICGILQQGVSTWDSGTIYYTGNFCSKNGKLYKSLTDLNQGNDPEQDSTNWEAPLDKKVNKSGDTMTGVLIIARNANPDLQLRNTSIDIKNFKTPTVNTHMSRVLTRDKNNIAVADLVTRITTDRSVETSATTTNYVDGVAKSSTIRWGVTSDGTAFTSAPTVATGDSSSNIATTKWVNNNSAIIAGWAMPSDKFTNLTLGASGTKYTAPANGYFYAQMDPQADKYIDWYSSTVDFGTVMTGASSNAVFRAWCPVRKGDRVTFYYNVSNPTGVILKFVYAEGAQ